MLNGLFEPFGPQRDASNRMFLAGAAINAGRQDASRCYLIQAGLVAATVTLDGRQPTCVGLLGPGMLIGLEPDFDEENVTYSYQAISAVNAAEFSAAVLRGSLRQHPVLAEAYQGQLQERLAQTKLVAACNAHHTLSERCARWLLRLHGNLGRVLPVTHAFISALLGVRRAGVSVTLQMLQREGAIQQQRGRLIVLDPGRLQRFACRCPNEFVSPSTALPMNLIGTSPPDYQRPRAWIERKIRDESLNAMTGDEQWKRRVAALRVCQAVLAQGQALLGA